MVSKLRKRIAEIFDIDVVRLNSNAEFGKSDFWDSLAHIKLLTYLVENLDVPLTEENFERYKKLRNIISDFE